MLCKALQVFLSERPELTANFSNTQIDQLGDRMRKGPITEADLILLDEYRRSFGEAYEAVLRTIQQQLQLEPTGRPAKSTSSIIEKLHRESIRLSQMQDIAGCRLVVGDLVKQEEVVASLSTVFPGASVIDRRANPSYGYRAVHIIPRIFEKLIEVQVRTSLQHIWAEYSEKLSDVFDPSIKYGGGDDNIRGILTDHSKAVREIEELEKKYADLHKKMESILLSSKLVRKVIIRVMLWRMESLLNKLRKDRIKTLKRATSRLPHKEEQEQ